jgi:hypothetical protein
VTIAELEAAKDAQPFRPFTLCMDDGREVLVDQPHTIAWGLPPGRTVVVVTETGTQVLVIDQILSLRFVDAGRRCNASKRETKMVAHATLTGDDIQLVKPGTAVGKFDVVSFNVAEWNYPDVGPPWVSICLMGTEGPDTLTSIALHMGPEQARKLAEAILASGVVSPERN